MTLTELQPHLIFKPLAHAPSINNAVIPINEHVQISVSYNRVPGLWNVGSINYYEAAIQVFDEQKAPGIRDLVSFEDNRDGNVFSGCDEIKLLALTERAQLVEYYGIIKVFAIKSGETKAEWGVRFVCARGYDYREKIKYTKSVFEGGWTFERKES